MKPSLPILLSLLPASMPALAAGLGELTVNSRIGEPLQAEVAIIAGANEKLEAICFSLARIKDAELPVITGGRLQLEQGQQGMLLRISAAEVLVEPLAMLRLRAGCGVELQRDYFVMPLPPESMQQSTTVTNRPIRTTEAAVISPSRQTETVPRAAPPRPQPPPKPRPEPAERGDRLVLGNSPMQLDYSLPPSIIEETEARMLRMETSLSRLDESLQKLEAAMLIGNEIKATEQQLQLAMALHQPPATGPAPLDNTVWRRWLELLAGTLLGGLLSAMALSRLARLRLGYQGR